MDGNGRWAKFNNKTRLEGHKKGVATVRKVIEEFNSKNGNFNVIDYSLFVLGFK